MPKILVVTFFHMTVAVGSGLFLGLSVFGVGFSDSKIVHETYGSLVILWQILNAPAGIYVLNVVEPNWAVFGLLQATTSFIWANAFGLIASFWKLRRRDKSLEPTR